MHKVTVRTPVPRGSLRRPGARYQDCSRTACDTGFSNAPVPQNTLADVKHQLLTLARTAIRCSTSAEAFCPLASGHKTAGNCVVDRTLALARLVARRAGPTRGGIGHA